MSNNQPSTQPHVPPSLLALFARGPCFGDVLPLVSSVVTDRHIPSHLVSLLGTCNSTFSSISL